MWFTRVGLELRLITFSYYTAKTGVLTHISRATSKSVSEKPLQTPTYGFSSIRYFALFVLYSLFPFAVFTPEMYPTILCTNTHYSPHTFRLASWLFWSMFWLNINQIVQNEHGLKEYFLSFKMIHNLSTCTILTWYILCDNTNMVLLIPISISLVKLTPCWCRHVIKIPRESI